MKRGALYLTLAFTLLILISQVNAFEFCDNGINGENKLRIISVDDMEKQNPTEWTWQNSEEIEIEVRVQNKDDDRKDYKIELVFVKNDEEVKIVEDEENLKKEFELDADERKSISFEFKTENDVEEDEYELYVKFYDKNNEDQECVENSEERVKIKKIKICENGNVDDDNLEINSITDESSETENQWEWRPNKNLEIKINVENKDYTIEEYVAKLILIDTNGEEVTFADDSNDIEKEVQIQEDETIDLNFEFELKNNLEEGTYYLYSKVYAKEDNDICTSLKAEELTDPERITIVKDEHNVIVTSVDGPKEVEGGQVATYTAIISNIGSIDEDRVKIMLYSSKLDINIQEEITDLEIGEEKQITFEITIPEDVEAITTRLRFSTEFKYDESTNYFEQVSADEDDVQYLLKLKLKPIIPEETTPEENPFENLNTDTPIETKATDATNTPITGAVVGKKDGGINFTTIIITIVVLLIAISGIFIYKNKKKKPDFKTDAYIEQPTKIARRYTAKLPTNDRF